MRGITAGIYGLIFAIVLTIGNQAFSADKDIRIAVLKFGTVNWELDTIKHLGLDKKYGFNLEVQGMAGKQAATIALVGGAADVIVSDWIWVSRQRHENKPYVFLPYSRQVGGVLVGADSGIRSLEDLNGKRIGVAGGPVDKSWLLVQAAALRRHNVDLSKAADIVYGAPPLLSKQMEAGNLDAIITFWHFAAKLKAKGYRELETVANIARELGLESEIPLLGFVYSEDWAKANPGAAEGLAKASAEAKARLATEDPLWHRLRPMMRAKDDAAYAQLIAGFRDGMPNGKTIDKEAAAELFAVLAELGGQKLVGMVPTLHPGTFAAQ